MLTAATAGAFMVGEGPLARAAWAIGIFGFACLASIVLYAAIGASLRDWLTRGSRLRVFNVAMGVSLAMTAIWMMLR